MSEVLTFTKEEARDSIWGDLEGLVNDVVEAVLTIQT